MNLICYLISLYRRVLYKSNQSKAISKINQTILMLKDEADSFALAIEEVEIRYGKNNEAAEIATIFPFLNLSMIDILILSKQYEATTDSIEKNFICRTAAHHMYEFLEDASKVLGKQMNTFIEKINNDEILSELKQLRIIFNKLKKELHTPLKNLRHHVSGHKDRDIRTQIQMSSSINTDDFQINFLQFMLFFLQLANFKKLVLRELRSSPDFQQTLNDLKK